jgi:hypothetical protein
MPHTALLQTGWPHGFPLLQPGQAVLQAPQANGELDRSAQLPPQFVWGNGQLAAQAPFAHTSPAAHWLVQLPHEVGRLSLVSQPSEGSALQSPQPARHEPIVQWPLASQAGTACGTAHRARFSPHPK